MIKNLGKRKLSIKQEVFYLGVVFSLVTLLLFGGILCTSIYYMQVNHAKQALSSGLFLRVLRSMVWTESL